MLFSPKLQKTDSSASLVRRNFVDKVTYANALSVSYPNFNILTTLIHDKIYVVKRAL